MDLNIAVTSLCYGGAERIVVDIVNSIANKYHQIKLNLYVLYSSDEEYPINKSYNINIHKLYNLSIKDKLSFIQLSLLNSNKCV